jgi:hypothetical protein
VRILSPRVEIWCDTEQWQHILVTADNFPCPVSSAHTCVQSLRKNIREDMENRWVPTDGSQPLSRRVMCEYYWLSVLMYTPGMSVMSLLLKNRDESKRSRDFFL